MYVVVDGDMNNVLDGLGRADPKVTRVMLRQLVQCDRHELSRDSPAWARLVEQVDKLHVVEVVGGEDFTRTLALVDSANRRHWGHVCGQLMLFMDSTTLLAASTGRAMKARGGGPRRLAMAVLSEGRARAGLSPITTHHMRS